MAAPRSLPAVAIVTSALLAASALALPAHPTEPASVAAGLDDPEGGWSYVMPVQEPTSYEAGVIGPVTYAHRGDSMLSLYQWSDFLERTVTGPGVARVWTAPRLAYRYSTQSTRMSLVGGAAVTITAPSRFVDPPYASDMWQLAELAVPAGTHTLRLENLPPVGTQTIQGLFDDFTFAPGGTLLSVENTPWVAQVGQPFEGRATANTSAIFSAEGLPTGLTIDPATGIISGIPQNTGEFVFTITATGAVTNDTKESSLTVTDLGLGADQPSWKWRTATSAAQAWRLIDQNTAVPATVDGVDAIETMTLEPVDSWVEADVSGPGWVKWKQKAGNRTDGAGATIAVVVDGVPVGPPVPPPSFFYGDRRVWIPAGTHTVRWTAHYTQGTPGTDWFYQPIGLMRIDTVTFEPSAGLPGALGSVTYDAWAAGLPEGQRGPDQDANGNGATNWTEYTFGPSLTQVWPAPVTTVIDGDWIRFSVPISASAAEGVWMLESWHDAIPNYPAGWSAAICLDHEFSAQGNILSAAINRAARTGTNPASVNPYLIEPAALPPMFSRFSVRRSP